MDENNAQQVAPETTEPTPTPNETETQSAVESQVDGNQPVEAEPIPDALGEQVQGVEAKEAVEGAPDTYADFTDVNGKTYSPEAVQGFTDVAKELGLSQEKAQKMFNAFVPTAYKYMHDDVVEKAKGWIEASRSDKEFGGDDFQKNLGIAQQAYQHYASPELKQILNSSGLGSHPEVIRMFFRVGRTMQQDTGVQGGTSAPATPRRRFPNSNMVVDE